MSSKKRSLEECNEKTSVKDHTNFRSVTALYDGIIFMCAEIIAETAAVCTYKATNRTRLYSLVTKEVKDGPSMNIARKDCSSVRLPDNKVLICGGTDENGKALFSTEIYDFKTEKITMGPCMNVARSLCASALFCSKKVLICGGIDEDGNPLASTEIYDAEEGKFKKGPNMWAKRGECTASTLASDKVFVCGSVSMSDIIVIPEIYCPEKNNFTTLMIPVGLPRSMSSYPLTDGRVLLIGGWNGSDWCTSSKILDTVTKEMTDGPQMKHPRPGCFLMCYYPDKITLIGGDEEPELIPYPIQKHMQTVFTFKSGINRVIAITRSFKSYQLLCAFLADPDVTVSHVEMDISTNADSRVSFYDKALLTDQEIIDFFIRIKPTTLEDSFVKWTFESDITENTNKGFFESSKADYMAKLVKALGF